MSENTGRWRALVRIIAIDYNYFWCVIPAWNSEVAIAIEKVSIPLDFSKWEVGKRFYAEVSLGVSDPDELNPTNFEESSKTS